MAEVTEVKDFSFQLKCRLLSVKGNISLPSSPLILFCYNFCVCVSAYCDTLLLSEIQINDNFCSLWIIKHQRRGI